MFHEEEEGEETGVTKKENFQQKQFLVAFNVYTKESFSFESLFCQQSESHLLLQPPHSNNNSKTLVVVAAEISVVINTDRTGYRGRGNRGGFRQSGETDPYDITIAPLNIYENQVIPVGLGTKFIPKWKFETKNNAFIYFSDFLGKMQNKVYFK